MHWYDTVRAEMEALMADRVASTNLMWETGRLPDAPHERTVPEFEARQYAPWFEGGLWSAGAAGWHEGNAQAAAYYQGKGVRWTMDQLTVLPRSATEAAVMCRISHWTPGAVRPTQALFLETWVKREGMWHLLRHVAEKAAPPTEER